MSQKVCHMMIVSNFGKIKCGPIFKILYQLIRKKILYVYMTKISTGSPFSKDFHGHAPHLPNYQTLSDIHFEIQCILIETKSWKCTIHVLVLILFLFLPFIVQLSVDNSQ